MLFRQQAGDELANAAARPAAETMIRRYGDMDFVALKHDVAVMHTSPFDWSRFPPIWDQPEIVADRVQENVSGLLNLNLALSSAASMALTDARSASDTLPLR